MISCVCQQRKRQIKKKREKLARAMHHKYVQRKTINRVKKKSQNRRKYLQIVHLLRDQ